MGAVLCRETALGAWEKVAPPGDRPGEAAEAAAWLLLLAGRCRLLPAAAGWREKEAGDELAGPRPRSNKRLVCHGHIALPRRPPGLQSAIATRVKIGSGLTV